MLPYDTLTGFFSYFAPYMGDYQKYNKVVLYSLSLIFTLTFLEPWCSRNEVIENSFHVDTSDLWRLVICAGALRIKDSNMIRT
jgi:hypothetical protein